MVRSYEFKIECNQDRTAMFEQFASIRKYEILKVYYSLCCKADPLKYHVHVSHWQAGIDFHHTEYITVYPGSAGPVMLPCCMAVWNWAQKQWSFHGYRIMQSSLRSITFVAIECIVVLLSECMGSPPTTSIGIWSTLTRHLLLLDTSRLICLCRLQADETFPLETLLSVIIVIMLDNSSHMCVCKRLLCNIILTVLLWSKLFVSSPLFVISHQLHPGFIAIVCNWSQINVLQVPTLLFQYYVMYYIAMFVF